MRRAGHQLLCATAGALCYSRSVNSEPKSAESPLFRFGAIADIQYAETEVVGKSFWGRPRYYGDSLAKARAAAAAWELEGCQFAINLGDAIDRSTSDHTRALASVMEALHGNKRQPVHPTLPQLHACSRVESGGTRHVRSLGESVPSRPPTACGNSCDAGEGQAGAGYQPAAALC